MCDPREPAGARVKGRLPTRDSERVPVFDRSTHDFRIFFEGELTFPFGASFHRDAEVADSMASSFLSDTWHPAYTYVVVRCCACMLEDHETRAGGATTRNLLAMPCRSYSPRPSLGLTEEGRWLPNVTETEWLANTISAICRMRHEWKATKQLAPPGTADQKPVVPSLFYRKKLVRVAQSYCWHASNKLGGIINKKSG